MGEIGKSLARMLNPFGCRLLARSSYLDPAAAAELGVELTTTEDLCERSDILIVATQPRADTAGILTAECVDRLRRGSIVVLVGRASTVDVPALYRRVLCGDLRLAIDVYEEEPLPAGHPLRGHPGVLHTPHIAGRTVEANRLMIEELVADLAAIRAGQPGSWTTTETRVVATAQAMRA
jgi:phosphoglycerate dehydrogenase-like enzyme